MGYSQRSESVWAGRPGQLRARGNADSRYHPDIEDLSQRHRDFYTADDRSRFGREHQPLAQVVTRRWIESCDIPDDAGAVIELGCGNGPLTEAHPSHVAVDISVVALGSREKRARGIACDMQRLPFRNESVDFFFSWAALEHVPNPERVLEEIERSLRKGGAALLAPAWHCRPWAAKALDTRPYSELEWKDRLVKATIPLRNTLAWRALFEIPARLLRELRLASARPLPFDYNRLEPNLTEFLGSDSDAFTSMDPHSAICYFISRGWRIPSHPTLRSRLLARHEPVVVVKPR